MCACACRLKTQTHWSTSVLCPQGPQHWGAPPPSLSQRKRDSSARKCSPCRHFEPQHYIARSVLQPRLCPPPKTGGELHSVPTGRVRQVRAAPRLDPLQPRAAGQHRRHRFDGQGHAHEAQVHLGLAGARYGNNVRNPNRRELLFHCTDSIITPFSMS